MTNSGSVYLVLLGGVLLGAIVFALTGLKQLRAQGDRIPPGQRLAAHLALIGSAFVVLATALAATAILQDAGDPNRLRSSLFTAIAVTLASGTVARLFARPLSS